MKREILIAIEAIDSQISIARIANKCTKELNKKKSELCKKLGEHNAGFRPGDVIVNPSGRRVKVIWVWSDVSYGFSAEGQNIKADGSLGVRRAIYAHQLFRVEAKK